MRVKSYFHPSCQVQMERTMYQRMMAVMAVMPRGNSAIHPTRKMYFTRLSCHVKLRNLSANNGTSAIRKKHDANRNRKRNTALKRGELRNGNSPTMSDAQKRALAGVGRPMNDVV